MISKLLKLCFIIITPIDKKKYILIAKCIHNTNFKQEAHGPHRSPEKRVLQK